MKKMIFAIVAGTMLSASISFAAPITDLQQTETTIGYNHYNLKANGQKINDDSVYFESGVAERFILGIERNSHSIPGADAKATDVYAQYKLDPNIRLIVGNRDYSDGPNKMFFGIGASKALTSRVDAYTSVTSSNIATEWQAGAVYKLNSQTALHLGYKSYKEDYAPRADGIGFGVNYTF